MIIFGIPREVPEHALEPSELLVETVPEVSHDSQREHGYELWTLVNS